MNFHNLPPAYVISRTIRKQRRENFFEQAIALGYEVQWLRATEPDEMVIPDWVDYPSVYACLNSHLRVYCEAVSRGHEFVLVFEDDVTINYNKTALLETMNSFSERADFYYLYTPKDWCLGAFGYVINCRLMREILFKTLSEPFPEGHLAHIDQLILSLLHSGSFKSAHTACDFVTHPERGSHNSDVVWQHSYRPKNEPPATTATDAAA